VANVVNDLIRRLDDGGAVRVLSRKIAEAVVDEHGDDLAGILQPLVARQITGLRRSRGHQPASGRVPGPAPSGEVAVPDPVAARRALLDSMVYDYVTHAYVAFCDMTCEQHDRRADALEARAGAIHQRAAPHRWAAGQLRSGQARSLRDLGTVMPPPPVTGPAPAVPAVHAQRAALVPPFLSPAGT
jgi:hypothetical protein